MSLVAGRIIPLSENIGIDKQILSSSIKYPIRLDQFLTLMNMVSSGGEAKILISEGLIKVNGEIEERRGRKLQLGDRVQLDNGEAVAAE